MVPRVRKLAILLRTGTCDADLPGAHILSSELAASSSGKMEAQKHASSGSQDSINGIDQRIRMPNRSMDGIVRYGESLSSDLAASSCERADSQGQRR